MAKPITVAEDEALKYYRLKNILTPPAIVELSELDKEMSDILSQSNLSSQERAHRYHKALIKFRNLYKDYFHPKQIPPVSEKKEDKKKQEIPELPEPIPFIIPPQTEEEMEKEDQEEEQKEVKMKDVIVHSTISLIPRAQKLQSALAKVSGLDLKKRNGYIIVYDPERKTKKRKTQEGLWNKTLNYLALSRQSKLPNWNEKRPKKFIQYLSKILVANKIVRKSDLEKYPNIAHTIENTSRPPSALPSFSPSTESSPTKHDSIESSPTKHNSIEDSTLMSDDNDAETDQSVYDERYSGSGLHVKFKKWNNTVHGL